MSIYRVSTANTYDVTMSNIAKRNADLATSQEQLSTGKRVIRASDDAVSATLSERARNRMARVEADERALEASRTALTQAESALGEATNLVHSARELMVQAGNPALSFREREDLAKQIEGLRDQMLNVANRADTSGLTLFGGLGGSSQPFVDVYGPNAGVKFEGQSGQYLPTESSLPHAIDGNAVWMNVPKGNGTFVVQLDAGNTGQARADLGAVLVTDPANLPPALQDPSNPTPPIPVTAATGTGYVVAFSDPGTGMEFAIYTGDEWDAAATPPGPVVGATSLASGVYVQGQSIDFDTTGATGTASVRITLEGAPADGDQINLVPNHDVTQTDQPGDIFQTLQNTIDALRYDGANQNAHLTQELARSLQETDAGLDGILAARGRLGEWLNRADSMQALFQDRQLAYEKENSDLTDVDMVKAISDFQNRQTAYQAALQSYAQVQRLSLFQYIA